MNANYTMPFRRKRIGKTNYKKRLALLKSGKPRLVVRRSSSNNYSQIVEYHDSGDKIIFSASSQELKRYGWKHACGNVPAAYLTGYLLGIKAKDKVKEAILDIGLNISTKGSRIYALLKGVIDAGIQIPCSEEILPTKERILGKHISDDLEKQVIEAKGNISKGVK